VIEGRDTVGMVGGAVGVLAVTALNVVARVKNDSDRK
jgi:hypothetical protein